MSGLIAFLTNLQNLLSIGVGVLVFATLVTLMNAMGGGAKLEDRMKAVAVRREELKRRSRQAIAAQGSTAALRHTDEGFKKRVVDKLNLTKMLEDPKVTDQMAQAGFRGPGPLTTFYFFRFAMPFVLFALAALYVFVLNDFGLPFTTRLVIVMAATVIGFYAPNIYLKNRIAKRRTSIMQAFPDALDLLLICVEAGMSMEHAFRKVSTEITTQSIPLAEELALCTAELSYLAERRQAYENLAQRTGLESVKSVSTALAQAERYGTPLGTALRTLAQESRDQRMMAAEKKAASLPPMLTVPMILFFLPVLFVVILTPALIQIMKWK